MTHQEALVFMARSAHEALVSYAAILGEQRTSWESSSDEVKLRAVETTMLVLRSPASPTEVLHQHWCLMMGEDLPAKYRSEDGTLLQLDALGASALKPYVFKQAVIAMRDAIAGLA